MGAESRKMKPRGVVSRREALSVARKLGAEVEPVNRTGEIRLRHSLVGYALRVNGRRKDASRHLLRFINDLQESLDAMR